MTQRFSLDLTAAVTSRRLGAGNIFPIVIKGFALGCIATVTSGRQYASGILPIMANCGGGINHYRNAATGTSERGVATFGAGRQGDDGFVLVTLRGDDLSLYVTADTAGLSDVAIGSTSGIHYLVGEIMSQGRRKFRLCDWLLVFIEQHCIDGSIVKTVIRLNTGFRTSSLGFIALQHVTSHSTVGTRNIFVVGDLVPFFGSTQIIHISQGIATNKCRITCVTGTGDGCDRSRDQKVIQALAIIKSV